MRKNIRILSAILVLSMLLTCLPTAVMADEDTSSDTTVTEQEDTTTAPADETAAENSEAATGEGETSGEGETPTEGEPAADPKDFETVSDEEALASMKLVAEKGNMQLYLAEDDKYLNIGVKNKATGEIWFTNPVNAKDDPYVTGSLKLQQQAQVWVQYVDFKNQSGNANSQVSSVNSGTYTVTQIEDGIKIVYDFSRKKELFSIPVTYTITEDSFKATVLTKEIDEGAGRTENPNRIMSITLIPHFGAGSINDTGYVFVPDGSGAVINFNNGQGSRLEYNQPVYGRDQAITLSVKYTVTQQQVLPVFGMVKNDHGYVAVITEGSDAEISALPSSTKSTAYNRVGTTFTLRKKDYYTMGEGNWNAKILTTIAPYTYESSDLQVEYFMLDQDDVSYAGMARRYREYLIETQNFEKKETSGKLPLFLEVYGAVTKDGNVLGFPTEEIVAMTTYKELASILQEAKNLGVDRTVVDYVGWQKGGPNKLVPTKMSFEKKLGGKSEYQNLLKTAEELDAAIFPRVEFLKVNGGGNGYSKSKLLAKNVNRTPIQVFKYFLGSGTKALGSTPSFLVSNMLLEEIYGKFDKAYSKLGMNTLSLDAMVNMQYTDYRSHAVYDRGYQQSQVSDILSKMSEKTSLLLKQPNAYAMTYADYISSVPSFSSDYLMEDYAVPFVQIVLHGWVPYSSPAISASGDIEEAFLKSIETGSNLLFTITAKETSTLKDSEYNYLYAADYSVWLDTAAEMYKELDGILGDLQSVEIKNHRKVEDYVFETLYENGTSILVNYGKKDVSVDGRTVKSMSYDVKKGGN